MLAPREVLPPALVVMATSGVTAPTAALTAVTPALLRTRALAPSKAALRVMEPPSSVVSATRATFWP